MSTRTGQAALDWARNQHYNPSRDWTRDCQMFVRSSFNVGGLYGSAITAWYNANRRHTSWPPAKAVPVFWQGGNYGHVALSLGDGTCWTTDYVRRGKIDRVRISAISSGWNYRYLGWSEDINEVRIFNAIRPIIDISNTIYAAKHSSAVTNGSRLKRALGAEYAQGSMDYSNNILGGAFRTQYKKLQVRWYGSGDGIPGAVSLTRLCHAQGLDVRA